jgi:hypothetical protein
LRTARQYTEEINAKQTSHLARSSDDFELVQQLKVEETSDANKQQRLPSSVWLLIPIGQCFVGMKRNS